MAEKSLPTALPNGKSNPDTLPAPPIRRTKKAGARAVLLDPEALEMLVVSGVQISGVTLPGLLQSYIRRGPEHYREPFAHQGELTAGLKCPVTTELVCYALSIAGLAETIREIIKAAQAEPDPAEASRLLDLAASYGWTAADKGDRLAVQIGKLAQALEAA